MIVPRPWGFLYNNKVWFLGTFMKILRVAHRRERDINSTTIHQALLFFRMGRQVERNTFVPNTPRLYSNIYIPQH